MLLRRPGSWWTRGAVASVLGPALLLGGCSQAPVHIDPPDLGEAEARSCRALLDDLPAELAGLPARAVSPAAARGAAWGDPALVLTCGAEEPEGFNRFSSCLEADGVGWYVPPEQEEDQESDVLLTAVGFAPRVSLLVPAEHRGSASAAALSTLAGPVQRHLELVDRCA